MTATNVRVQMQQRRDTAANWTSTNPTLLNGELGYETDTKKFKVGNGTAAWSALAYVPGFAISAYPLATADIADNAITAVKIADGVIANAEISSTAEIAVSKLGNGSARQLLQTDAGGSGVEFTSNVDVPGTLDVTSAATFDNNVTIQGNLTVNGTTTTIDTTTLVVEDKNIEMGAVSTPSDTTADGGGITLKGATDKTLTWVDSTDCWTFNQGLNLTAGTAGAPALVFNGDVNSGLFQPGADSLAIATAGAQRVTVDSSGNVGIGTSSPQRALVVSDAGTEGFEFYPGSSSGNNTVNHYNRSTAAFVNINTTADQHIFGRADGEKMRIDSSGRLLVGSTSSFASANCDDLQVGNTGTAATGLTIGSSNQGQIAFADSGDQRAGLIHYQHTDNSMRFFTSGAANERLRIDSSGKVGIGTSSAQYLLHIKGGSGTSYRNLAWFQGTGTHATAGFDRAVALGASNNGAHVDGWNGTTGSRGGSYLLLQSAGGNVGIGQSSPTHLLHVGDSTNSLGNTAGNESLNFRIQSATANSDFLNFTAKRLSTGSDWTTAAQRIQRQVDNTLQGYIQFGNDNTDLITFGKNNTEQMRIDSLGRVGIGTTSFDTYSQLHVVGSSTNPLFSNTTGAGGGGLSLCQNGVRALYVGTAGSSWLSGSATTDGLFRTEANLLFATNGNNERMRIDSSGRVGIGTTSPNAKLHVNGNLNVVNSGATLAEFSNPGVATVYLGISGQSTNYYDANTQIFRAGNSSSERMRIDSSGNLGIGTSSPNARLMVNAGITQTFGSAPLAIFGSGFAAGYYSTIGFGPTSSTYTIPPAGIGYTPTSQTDGGKGDLVFGTRGVTTNSAPTERMRISSDGLMFISHNTSNNKVFRPESSSTSYSSDVIQVNCARSGSSTYNLFKALSSNLSDVEFKLAGNGIGYSDGGWTTPASDYAEFFEWVDGNPNNEDRRGISVVLDGNKIREAIAGEEPLGIVSARPSIVGDAATDHWKEKHLTDEFGSYIMEPHNVVTWKDEDGKEHNYEDWNMPADVVVPDNAVVAAADEKGITFEHRKLNPDYDPSQAYISRADRPEWDTVGLLGKLRMRKGQITSARWIKMRDINDSVEEWLVR